jgi:uncharacterized protein YerC
MAKREKLEGREPVTAEDGRDLRICEMLDKGRSSKEIMAETGASQMQVSRIRTALKSIDAEDAGK